MVALVLYLLGLSVGSLEISHNTPAASSRESDPREGGIISHVFYDPASEVTRHHFCNVLLVTQVSTISLSKGTTHGCGNQQVSDLGGWLHLVYTL